MSPDSLIIQTTLAAGLYKNAQTVAFTCNKSSATIYYTTDGSRPSPSSARFTNPVLVDSTTIFQAIAYNGNQKSQVLVSSYIINENTKFPVISIAIEPEILFNSGTGLFKMGPRAARNFPHFGANYYSNKKPPCHIEFFEPNGEVGFSTFCNFKIFGGMSRIFPQKSLAFFANDSLGAKRFKHQIFPDLPIKSFKTFILRNSGSDFGETHYRDAFITSLGKEMGLDVQAYRPAIVYINGKFWGILNLREKLNEHYIANHYPYDKDSLDVMEHKEGRNTGSRKHYMAMQEYMRNNDLSDDKHLAKIASMMEIDNFLDYQIVQIYIGNQDAGGNIKFWRPQTPNGRWRWILFDTDFGFGHAGGSSKDNSLAFHTEPNGPAWPNPAWSTFNLRQLLKNKKTREAFIIRFLDRINTTFDSTHVIQRIDSMANYLKPEIYRHLQRWDLEESRWNKEIDRMRKFARDRPANMRLFIKQMFPEVGQEATLRIEITGAGKVVLNNTATIEKTAFQGIYFDNLPLQMAAVPTLNSRFSHWEVNGKKIDTKTFKLNFKSKTEVVKAIFVAGEHPFAKSVIINEIGCHDTTAGDWIEFYNSSSEKLNLKNWQLIDKAGNDFIFGDISLAAGEYLILAQDIKLFKKAYPEAKNIIAGLSFGLDKKKDAIQLLDSENAPVDSFAYQIENLEKNANVVLALKDYATDNAKFENWQIESKGSPALINPQAVAVTQRRQIGNVLFYVGIGGAGAAAFGLGARAYVKSRKRKIRK